MVGQLMSRRYRRRRLFRFWLQREESRQEVKGARSAARFESRTLWFVVGLFNLQTEKHQINCCCR